MIDFKTMDRLIPLAQSAGVCLSMRHGITHRFHETPDPYLPNGFRRRYYPHVTRKGDRKMANELQRRADDLYEKIADLLVSDTK